MTIDNTGFRVDLRLLLELGERLISRDEVAVVELVKNAYDADAKKVDVKVENVEKEKIEIKDTGTGMGQEEITDGWLTLGTSMKKRCKRTELGRRVLGEKGLGRLAVLRLGRLITIHTLKHDGVYFKIVMDWDKSKHELVNNNYSPLSQMKLEIKKMDVQDSELFPEGHGTVIVIEKLNALWDDRKIERLKVSLSQLVEPSFDEEQDKDEKKPEGEKKFSINFYLNKKITEIKPPLITKNPHYFLDVDVKATGAVFGKLNWKMGSGQKEELIKDRFITKIKIKQPGKEGGELKYPEQGIGEFKFTLAVWDLDLKDMREYKNTLNQWSGISLYRDGFRVVQPDVDWLGLELAESSKSNLAT